MQTLCWGCGMLDASDGALGAHVVLSAAIVLFMKQHLFGINYKAN